MRLRSEEAPPYQEHDPLAVLIEFALYWASLILLRAMQLRVKLPSTIVVLFVDSFLPLFQSCPGNSREVLSYKSSVVV